MPSLKPEIFQRHQPFANFSEASNGILKHLHKSYGMNLWMVTRTEGEDWIVLHAEDHGYEVKQGDVFRWSDSFCSRMVEGEGPLIAPDSREIPCYLEAPIGQQVDIAAYVGIPLTRQNGELFGTLCAIHPEPRFQGYPAERLTEIESEISCYSKLLSSILEYELLTLDAIRELDQAREAAQLDTLTGLYNRLGWNNLTKAEERRCRNYGTSAAILIIDLDKLKRVNDSQGHKAGDRLLVLAAQTIRKLLPDNAVAARLGGDEFGVLLSGEHAADAEKFALSLDQELRNVNAAASIGFSLRNPHDGGLETAQERADYQMLKIKRKRNSTI
jgi:diguanylate cyclase (GGDEF)-like protein